MAIRNFIPKKRIGFDPMNIKAISKKFFGPTHLRRTSLCVGPRFNSSEHFSMRVEDPVRRGGLNIGPAFLSRQSSAGDLESKSYF